MAILDVLLPDGTLEKRLLVRDFLAMLPNASVDCADFCRLAAEPLRAAGWQHFSFGVVGESGSGDGEAFVADKNLALALVAIVSDISKDQQRELCERICRLFVPDSALIEDPDFKLLAQVRPESLHRLQACCSLHHPADLNTC